MEWARSWREAKDRASEAVNKRNNRKSIWQQTVNDRERETKRHIDVAIEMVKDITRSQKKKDHIHEQRDQKNKLATDINTSRKDLKSVDALLRAYKVHLDIQQMSQDPADFSLDQLKDLKNKISGSNRAKVQAMLKASKNLELSDTAKARTLQNVEEFLTTQVNVLETGIQGIQNIPHSNHAQKAISKLSQDVPQEQERLNNEIKTLISTLNERISQPDGNSTSARLEDIQRNLADHLPDQVPETIEAAIRERSALVEALVGLLKKSYHKLENKLKDKDYQKIFAAMSNEEREALCADIKDLEKYKKEYDKIKENPDRLSFTSKPKELCESIQSHYEVLRDVEMHIQYRGLHLIEKTLHEIVDKIDINSVIANNELNKILDKISTYRRYTSLIKEEITNIRIECRNSMDTMEDIVKKRSSTASNEWEQSFTDKKDQPVDNLQQVKNAEKSLDNAELAIIKKYKEKLQMNVETLEKTLADESYGYSKDDIEQLQSYIKYLKGSLPKKEVHPEDLSKSLLQLDDFYHEHLCKLDKDINADYAAMLESGVKDNIILKKWENLAQKSQVFRVEKSLTFSKRVKQYKELAKAREQLIKEFGKQEYILLKLEVIKSNITSKQQNLFLLQEASRNTDWNKLEATQNFDPKEVHKLIESDKSSLLTISNKLSTMVAETKDLSQSEETLNQAMEKYKAVKDYQENFSERWDEIHRKLKTGFQFYQTRLQERVQSTSDFLSKIKDQDDNFLVRISEFRDKCKSEVEEFSKEVQGGMQIPVHVKDLLTGMDDLAKRGYTLSQDHLHMAARTVVLHYDNLAPLLQSHKAAPSWIQDLESYNKIVGSYNKIGKEINHINQVIGSQREQRNITQIDKDLQVMTELMGHAFSTKPCIDTVKSESITKLKNQIKECQSLIGSFEAFSNAYLQSDDSNSKRELREYWGDKVDDLKYEVQERQDHPDSYNANSPIDKLVNKIDELGSRLSRIHLFIAAHTLSTNYRDLSNFLEEHKEVQPLIEEINFQELSNKIQEVNPKVKEARPLLYAEENAAQINNHLETVAELEQYFSQDDVKSQISHLKFKILEKQAKDSGILEEKLNKLSLFLREKGDISVQEDVENFWKKEIKELRQQAKESLQNTQDSPNFSYSTEKLHELGSRLARIDLFIAAHTLRTNYGDLSTFLNEHEEVQPLIEQSNFQELSNKIQEVNAEVEEAKQHTNRAADIVPILESISSINHIKDFLSEQDASKETYQLKRIILINQVENSKTIEEMIDKLLLIFDDKNNFDGTNTVKEFWEKWKPEVQNLRDKAEESLQQVQESSDSGHFIKELDELGSRLARIDLFIAAHTLSTNYGVLSTFLHEHEEVQPLIEANFLDLSDKIKDVNTQVEEARQFTGSRENIIQILESSSDINQLEESLSDEDIMNGIYQLKRAIFTNQVKKSESIESKLDILLHTYREKGGLEGQETVKEFWEKWKPEVQKLREKAEESLRQAQESSDSGHSIKELDELGTTLARIDLFIATHTLRIDYGVLGTFLKEHQKHPVVQSLITKFSFQEHFKKIEEMNTKISRIQSFMHVKGYITQICDHLSDITNLEEYFSQDDVKDKFYQLESEKQIAYTGILQEQIRVTEDLKNKCMTILEDCKTEEATNKIEDTKTFQRFSNWWKHKGQQEHNELYLEAQQYLKSDNVTTWGLAVRIKEQKDLQKKGYSDVLALKRRMEMCADEKPEDPEVLKYVSSPENMKIIRKAVIDFLEFDKQEALGTVSTPEFRPKFPRNEHLPQELLGNGQLKDDLMQLLMVMGMRVKHKAKTVKYPTLEDFKKYTKDTEIDYKKGEINIKTNIKEYCNYRIGIDAKNKLMRLYAINRFDQNALPFSHMKWGYIQLLPALLKDEINISECKSVKYLNDLSKHEKHNLLNMSFIETIIHDGIANDLTDSTRDLLNDIMGTEVYTCDKNSKAYAGYIIMLGTPNVSSASLLINQNERFKEWEIKQIESNDSDIKIISGKK